MTEPSQLTPEPASPADNPPAAGNEVREGIRSRNIKRGVRTFVIIGIIATVVIMVLTVNRETLDGLTQLRPHWLALTILLWCLAMTMDSLRLMILSRVGEHRLSFFRSLGLILAGFFMAAITPFQVGGLPIQLYAMNKWGISPGKGTAIMLVRTILFYGMLFIASPIIGLYFGVDSILLKILFTYIGAIAGIGAVLVTLTVFFPKIIIRWRWRLSRKTNPGRFRVMVVRGLGEFRQFADSTKLYFVGRNIGYLLLAALLSIAFALSFFGMTAAILGGLGVITANDIPRVMGLNVLLMTVLLYIPTPGAGGVAEAAAAGLYSMFCPRHMLGIFVLLWRLFSFYINAFLGGMIALKHIAQKDPEPKKY